MVFDLGAVSHLGVTAALALEEAVLEKAVEAGRRVYVVGAAGTARKRLDALKLFDMLPADHTRLTRAQAQAAAVEAISG